MPEPEAPPFELLPKVVVDAFIITIVAYTISFSMAKIFAKKHNYEVDAAQELYSQVLINMKLLCFILRWAGENLS